MAQLTTTPLPQSSQVRLPAPFAASALKYIKSVTRAANKRVPGLRAGGQGSAVAIIRISGAEAVPIATMLFRRGAPPTAPPPVAAPAPPRFTPQTHRIYYGHAVNASGQLLDEVLLLPMLAPRSFTREDVVELHCHGGTVPARRLLDACLAAGARLARAGEFTLRAFLNGRLDLAQAEAVSELVAARTASAADSALAGLAVRFLDI